MKNNNIIPLPCSGCLGSISVYASDTGKLISTNMKHMARISSLNFSPNFKYLVSTAQDKTVGVFIWPDLTPCYHIKFAKNIKVGRDKLFSRYFIFNISIQRVCYFLILRVKMLIIL